MQIKIYTMKSKKSSNIFHYRFYITSCYHYNYIHFKIRYVKIIILINNLIV